MINRPKGTLDLINKDARKFKYIKNYTDDFMCLYNYEYIKIPTFEVSELFKRGIGNTTDIVNKQTYDFLDKSNRSMTLRPEFTAGIVRSFIENKEYAFNKLKKYYYFGSCFRYERPQSGRLREFTQCGVEVLGGLNPKLDAEVINLAYNYLIGLGIKNLKVLINTIGDNESRKKYNEALKIYLEKDKENLCDICKERLERNPLRILDCKYDSKRDYIKNVPKIKDYLNEESLNYFNEVKKCLDLLEIPYEEDNTLVRGLDYYTHTVFEIVVDKSRSNTLCGGGRYDKLVELLGGPSTPGIGFSMGIERVMEMISNDFKNNIDIYIMNLTDSYYPYILLNELRSNGYICETDYSNKKMKNQWKMVEELNPTFILIIGEDEIKEKYITVKDNATKIQTKVNMDEIIEYLDTYF